MTRVRRPTSRPSRDAVNATVVTSVASWTTTTRAMNWVGSTSASTRSTTTVRCRAGWARTAAATSAARTERTTGAGTATGHTATAVATAMASVTTADTASTGIGVSLTPAATVPAATPRPLRRMFTVSAPPRASAATMAACTLTSPVVAMPNAAASTTVEASSQPTGLVPRARMSALPAVSSPLMAGAATSSGRGSWVSTKRPAATLATARATAKVTATSPMPYSPPRASVA